MPIWFVVDGEDLVFVTHSSSVKARNLRRTAYAAVSVDDPHPPFSVPLPRELAERIFDVRIWSEHPAGGHFTAWEQPEAFADDLRAAVALAQATD